MKSRINLFFIFLTLFVLPGGCLHAQNGQTDSLFHAYATAKDDTTRLNALNQLAWALRNSKQDSAISVCRKALLLAEMLPDSTQTEIKDEQLRIYLSKTKSNKLALSNYQMGNFLNMKQDYRGALGFLIKASVWSEKTKDKIFRSKVLTDFGYTYWRLINFQKALEYLLQAQKIADSTGDKKQQVAINNILGNVSSQQDNYVKALDYYSLALKIADSIGDKGRAATLMNNMGATYWSQGNYLKALDCDFNALRREEEVKDSNDLALTLGNIGLVYSSQGNNSQSLDYMYRALKLENKMGHKFQVARNIGNISGIYSAQGEFAKALNYNFWALNLMTELKEKLGMISGYSTAGDIYIKQGDSAWAKGNFKFALENKYANALYYLFLASRKGEDIGEPHALSFCLGNIAHIRIRQGKYVEGENLFLRALSLADSIGAQDLQEQEHKSLSELYYQTGDYFKAFQHQKAYTVIKDTLFNKDKSIESSRKEMNYEYDKKTAIMKAEQEKKGAILASEKKRQRIIMLSVSAVLLLALTLATLIYRSNLQKQKANKMLEQKNNTIEQQKRLVEDKNHHITESINYAKRIQEAILPLSLFEPEEASDYFIYHLPKDIVSGDFYWRFKDGDDLFIAVVDCTGHGVPGAMMSMLGYDMLEYAVKDKHLREPGLILQSINEQMMEKLLKSNPGGSTDGMDVTLCKLHKKSMLLTYAGAKNGLIIANHEEELILLPVDKCSIGDQAGFAFSQHSVQLTPKQAVYLFTDGYADQKGGPDHKKYMSLRFKQFLKRINNLPCEDQKEQLQLEFKTWKGESAQKDDVLVIGFKVHG